MDTYKKNHTSKIAMEDHIAKIKERGGVIINKFGSGEHYSIEYSFNPAQKWALGDKFKSNIELGMGTHQDTVFNIEKKEHNGFKYKVSFKVGELDRFMSFDENFLTKNFSNGNFIKK